MKAMILAAGRGQRLRPLTDTVPKPLLQVGGRRLIEHHLLALAAAGFREVVINVAWLAEQIVDTLGDGSAYGLDIAYSREQPGALDTGGGIRQALDRLGREHPFALLNADVYTDFPVAALRECRLTDTDDAHLVLTANPPHHPQGDFSLVDGRIGREHPRYTYTGIGVYRPGLFLAGEATRFALVQALAPAIEHGRVAGQLYAGRWHDVGTPRAFAELGGRLG